MNDPYLPAPSEPAALDKVDRWRMIRDLVVFQIKLVVDGFKDIVLGPLSLVTGMIDIVQRNPPSRSLFRGVIRAGASFDRWVGLFDDAGDAELDTHLRRLEQMIIAQQQRGGLTVTAKQAIDHTLDLLEKRLHETMPSERGPSDGTEPGPTPYSGP